MDPGAVQSNTQPITTCFLPRTHTFMIMVIHSSSPPQRPGGLYMRSAPLVEALSGVSVSRGSTSAAASLTPSPVFWAAKPRNHGDPDPGEAQRLQLCCPRCRHPLAGLAAVQLLVVLSLPADPVPSAGSSLRYFTWSPYTVTQNLISLAVCRTGVYTRV